MTVTTDELWDKVKELKEIAVSKFHRSKEPEQPDQMRAFHSGQYDGLCIAAAILDRFISDAEKGTSV